LHSGFSPKFTYYNLPRNRSGPVLRQTGIKTLGFLANNFPRCAIIAQPTQATDRDFLLNQKLPALRRGAFLAPIDSYSSRRRGLASLARA
jgi:hypothetical protein